MAWQDTFNAPLGPGLFAGVSAGDWIHVLRANGFAIGLHYAPRLLAIMASSDINAVTRRVESWSYGHKSSNETVEPPLFVLGHWRSGTTHLHNLLSQDDRVAYPNLYQVLFPHTFLTTEAANTRLLSVFVPKTRFGIDNVALRWDLPYEDEFAIAAASGLSPYVSMAFPRAQRHYDRFLTLADASTTEVTQWKTVLTTFLQKLTLKYHRRLILKSPTHTCRIKLLLELFPDAKFVHIRRNPFHVFQSMKRMIAAGLLIWNLQDPSCVDWEKRVVRSYREMYDAYFRQRDIIPSGRLYEICFEELELDPVEQVRRIYAELKLPEFAYVEPKLRCWRFLPR